MSRAVLLPTTGDPFTTAAWISSYNKCYKQHIDKLYVCVNSPVEKLVFDYVVTSFKDLGAEVLEFDRMLDHGPGLTNLLDLCKEDYVFISEDDFYVQNPNKISEWFQIVESGRADLVGSMRGCVGQEIIQAAARKFGLGGREAGQPSFWPCLLVAKAEDLRRTDKNFAGKRFDTGVHIPELNFTPKKTTGGDTFVWASIQLRALGLRVHQVDQNRLIDVLLRRQFPPQWVHVGSGSNSLNGHLLDENMIPIANTRMTKPKGFPPVPDNGIREHYERKFAWWKVFNEQYPIKDPQANYFNKMYRDAVARSIAGCGLRAHMVAKAETEIRQILAPTFGA